MIAHLGSDVVAAHAIAINIDSLAFMIPLGVASALTIKVAMAEGAGDAKLARRFCIVGYKLALILGLSTAALKIILREDLTQLFSADPNVQFIATNLVLVCRGAGLCGLHTDDRQWCAARLQRCAHTTDHFRWWRSGSLPSPLPTLWPSPIFGASQWASTVSGWGLLLVHPAPGIGLMTRWNIVSRRRNSGAGEFITTLGQSLKIV